jgi:hypothetical protein
MNPDYPPEPYPPGPPPPQQVFVVNTPPPNSVYAIVGLVMSILGLVTGCCTFGVFSAVAIICGHAGLIETRNNAKSGHGMAVAALVMGYLGIVPAVFLSIAWVTGSLTYPTTSP